VPTQAAQAALQGRLSGIIAEYGAPDGGEDEDGEQGVRVGRPACNLLFQGGQLARVDLGEAVQGGPVPGP
jgi:hypothetical protein